MVRHMKKNILLVKKQETKGKSINKRSAVSKSASRILEKSWNRFLQLLFPLRCPVCDDIVTPAGEKICPACRSQLKQITAPWCMRCGKKLQEEGEYCPECQRKERPYIRGRALYEYSSARLSIYRFKYGGRREYAAYFGEQMAENLKEFITGVRPDGLVPIPLHKSRRRKRGYNQAGLLAREVGKRLDIPVYDKLLVRTKKTAPLKKLNARERQNNLKKAFNVAQNDVKLKVLIIVDDIYTTGSTIEEAARVLRAAGVKKVYFITLAAV